MNPQPRFFRCLALVAALCVGLSACGEDTIVFPDPLPTISASPPTMNLVVGQTQAIIPTITGLTNTAVTYTSSNAAVASVTPAGVVTAVGVGAATISVVSQAQPTLQTGVGVNVTAAPVGPPVDSARVIIQSVTRGGTIFPVAPDSVTDVIDVTMSVTRGNARDLRVYALVGTANTRVELTQCRQTFGAAASLGEGVSAQEVAAQTQNIVCSFDTRAFTPGTGANALRGIPTFPNGPFRIRAELTNAAGAVLDAAQTGQYRLANSDFIRAAVVSRVAGTATAQNTAIGDTGLLWYGNGDLELQLTPVIFSAASATAPSYPGRISVTLNGYVNGQPVTTTRDTTVQTNGGFIVRFPRTTGNFANGNLANFNTGPEGTQILINTVTIGGQPGPSSATGNFVFTDLQSGTALVNSILRWDNERPERGRLTLGRHPAVNAIWARNGWVNAAYNWFSGKDGEHDAPFIRNDGATGPRSGISPAPSPAIPTAALSALTALPADALRGVGYDSTVIFVRPGSATLPDTAVTAVIANNLRFTRASGTVGTRLAQTITNSEIAVVARIWDRLGNFSDVILSRSTNESASGTQTGSLIRAGADFNIPVITGDSIIFPYNPVTSYTVTARDSLDGLAVIRVNRMTHACPAGTASGRQCAPAPATNADTTDVTGTSPGQGTSWRTLSVGPDLVTFTRSPSAISVEAYHRFDSRAWDRAGNATGVLPSSTFILDRTNPLVGNVQLPTNPLLVGGTSYDFAARVSDNVDMRRGSVGFDFSDGVQLPFQLLPLTVFGPAAVVQDSLLTSSVPFVRTLAHVQAGGAPPGTPTVTPVAARFRIWDHSTLPGRFSTQATNIVPNTVDAGRRNWAQGAAAIGGQPSYDINRTAWSGDVWQVFGRTGTFVNPFSTPGRVLFYARINVNNIPGEPATVVNYLLGPAAGVGVQDTGESADGRVWTFTAPAIPLDLAQSGLPFALFAVGITANGDALVSTDRP